MPINQKKREYAARVVRCINEYKSVFVVEADNVGSKQMQQVRHALRGTAEVVMGKNTTLRRVLRDFMAENPEHPVEALYNEIYGNIGLVFTNSDLVSVRDALVENKVPAPARVGSVAPVDVYVEPGPTGCDPGQTSWFQALNIATKINRGQIEIISRVHLVAEGDKVGDSQAALLQKLDIRPFSYGLIVRTVYDDGETFSPVVLDLTPEDLLAKLQSGIRAVAAIGLQVGYPTKASFVHSINNAYKALLAIGMGTDYKFGKVLEFENFAAAAAAMPAAGAGGDAAEEAPAQEEEESESAGGAGGLFDDDDDDW